VVDVEGDGAEVEEEDRAEDEVVAVAEATLKTYRYRKRVIELVWVLNC
jgi:hypothetical protein